MRHENELIWEADLWCNFLDEGWFVVTCLKSVCKHQSAVGWLVSLVGLVGLDCLVGWLVGWLVGGLGVSIDCVSLSICFFQPVHFDKFSFGELRKTGNSMKL